ncbi:MAG: hemerythrin domain-containing protein [Gallionella sp.]
MKRAQLLIQLSREHHAALVMAKRARSIQADDRHQFLHDFERRWNKELAPHFAEEERMLPPLLEAAGEASLVERLLSDHQQLRALSRRLIDGDIEAGESFGKLLAEHVRFEERELFPRYEILADANSVKHQ